jgi:hypothetical protein
MSEEDVRGGLRDAVADEPPLDFDPDALVATARHQVTRRRSLIAVGMATVAVAVAAVAVPVALGRGPTQMAGDQPTVVSTPMPTPPSPSSVPWPPSDVQPRDYTIDELRSRGEQMKIHLETVVPALLPQGSAFEFDEFGGEASGQFYEEQTSVNAEFSFQVDVSRYSVFVSVWAPGGANELLDMTCAAGGDACQQLGEHDGGPVMARTEKVDAEHTITTVYHFRKDGGVVQIAAYNYDMGGDTPAMPTIPVTLDQQKALATDPRLGL